MGCAQPTPKKTPSNLKPEAAPPAQAEVNPAPVPKISSEQAEKRRRQLRNNLQEGHCNPPKIVLPKIQPLQTE